MFICQHPSSLSESLLGVIATGDQMTCIFILNKIPALWLNTVENTQDNMSTQLNNIYQILKTR